MSSITVRKFNPDTDSGIIFSTWPKGFYYGGLEIGIKPSKEHWFGDYFQYVKDTLKTAQTHIACLTDAPDTIIGYAVINGTTLEWIYVKELFRKQGVASLLIKNKLIDSFNNLTKVGQAILEAQKLKEKPDGRTEDRQEKQGIQGTSEEFGDYLTNL